MKFDFVLTRPIEIRTPFQALSVPLVARVYKRGFDGQLLGKADPWLNMVKQLPTAQDKMRLMWKLAAHIMMHGINLPTQQGLVSLAYGGAKTKLFHFNPKNPQSLHYWVLDRFKKFGYEPEVGAVMDSLIKTNDIVIDAGSNSGYFPLFIASKHGFNGVIHAFEPVPSAAKELNSILQETGLYSRVSLHTSALWNQTADGALFISDNLHTGLAEVHADTKGDIKLCTLDSFNLSPSLIKADVEGSEYNLFVGAHETITKHKPTIVYESYIDPKLGPVSSDASPHDFLQDMGYTLFQPCWRKHDGEKSFLQPTPVNSIAEAQELVLVPFNAKNRDKGPAKINVVAIHEDRIVSLQPNFRSETWHHQGAPIKLVPALQM